VANPTKIPTTSFAVLGLLGREPMSGYDLVRLVEDSIAHFWTINKSHVYKELARLEELGYITGTSVHQERLPDKRIYKQTAAGRKALADWLNSPGHEPDRFRSGFLVKLFFGDEMTPKGRREMFADYRERAESYRQHLAAIVESLSADRDEFIRATALLGLREVEACLSWVDEVSKELPLERKMQ
jgi:DNA-binding PadR family transcriptional regulator